MSTTPPADGRLFHFVAGASGPWTITQVSAVAGEVLPVAGRLLVEAGEPSLRSHSDVWSLRGIRSNERYVVRSEKDALLSKQEGLGRPGSTCAALIPVRKSAAWWALSQDERRQVFEEQSRHIAIGLEYLPGIARRLLHCRDLGPDEPFDFLTWFEYSAADSSAFEELVLKLRESPEWAYVEREVDIRLVRAEG
jgi:hypothetical protein